MIKSELIAKNPLRAFDQQREGGLKPGQVGLVTARAGTGKTALLIHIALDNLFRGNQVLHVSVGETVSHVQAWYDELYRDLAVGYDLEESRKVWEEASTSRLILTFRNDFFKVSTLKERLHDLTAQNIFNPRLILIDGIDLNKADNAVYEEIRSYARDNGLKIWVAARAHASNEPIAEQIKPLLGYFDVALTIEPQSDSLRLKTLKNLVDDGKDISVCLDPKTYLLLPEKKC